MEHTKPVIAYGKPGRTIAVRLKPGMGLLEGLQEACEEAGIKNGVIVSAAEPSITAQCIRVPVSNGHMGAVFVKFKDTKPSREEMIKTWAAYKGRPQELKLPSAPEQFLQYFAEDNRPQTGMDRMLGNGMTVSIGRLREDTQYDYKFVSLAHNTLRGAAGGAVELAELLCAEGWMD